MLIPWNPIIVSYEYINDLSYMFKNTHHFGQHRCLHTPRDPSMDQAQRTRRLWPASGGVVNRVRQAHPQFAWVNEAWWIHIDMGSYIINYSMVKVW